jgi:hypothetical protein
VAGNGLIPAFLKNQVAVEGESGLIAYANRTSEVLFDWLGSSSLVGHHFRYCLHRPDWDSFRLFQQNVMASRARGEVICEGFAHFQLSRSRVSVARANSAAVLF